jgi:hypothetical protein
MKNARNNQPFERENLSEIRANTGSDSCLGSIPQNDGKLPYLSAIPA